MPPLRLLKVEPKMVIKISNLRWGQIQYNKNSFCIKANTISQNCFWFPTCFLAKKLCALARRIQIHFWRIPLRILGEIQAGTIGTRFARLGFWLQKNLWVRCWCVYCTKLETIFKIMFGELSPFRHDPASAPRQPRGLSFRFCCVAPPSPHHAHAFFVFARFWFSFFGMVVARRGRVSPKGETGGIQMRTRFCQNYFLGKRIWQNLGWFFRPQKGVWGMNAGGFTSKFFVSDLIRETNPRWFK